MGASEWALPRYCRECGEFLTSEMLFCPQCGTGRPSLDMSTTAQVAELLDYLTWLRGRGEIDARLYERLRLEYEARLLRIRPSRPEPEPAPLPEPTVAVEPARVPLEEAAEQVWAAEPAPVAATVVEPPTRELPPRTRAVPRPARPAKPPKPPREWAVREWAANRQADLLLYLGAFMLSIAALIFVNYQGSALSGAGRTAILATYTAVFLGFGLVLRRWERVQEAGPVFVALGAILTPLTFAMLYLQVLSDKEVSQASIWLLGSGMTSALYVWLNYKGYGRVYLAPAAIAALIAWGSLAATLELPPVWFGAWFMALGAGINALGAYRYTQGAGWFRLAAVIIAAPSMAFAMVAAAVSENGEVDALQLPAAFALALAGTAASARAQDRAEAFAFLPLLGSGLVGSLAWALAVPHLETIYWWPAWILLVAWGYLAVAAIRPGNDQEWGIVASGVGAFGLAIPLLVAFNSGREHEAWAMPVTDGLALAGVLGAWYRWRSQEAAGAVPPLAAMTAASVSWASGRWDAEWLGLAVAATGLGYLALEFVDSRYVRAWRQLAVAFAVAGVAIAHVAAAAPATDHWQLAWTYGVALAGALWEAAGRRQAWAWLGVPGAATGLALSSMWAGEVDRAQWAWAPLLVAAAVAATEGWWKRDKLLALVMWPYALTLALGPLPFIEIYRDVPGAGALAFAAAAALWLWASWRTDGALMRLMNVPVTEQSTRSERQVLGMGAGALGLVAVAYTNQALGLDALQAAWVFAGVGAAAWLGAGGLSWLGRDADGTLLPTGAGAFVIASAVRIDFPADVSPILGVAAVTAAVAARGKAGPAWRLLVGVSGVLAIAAGHAAAVQDGSDAWQLPAAYGFFVAAYLWDALLNRKEAAWVGVPGPASAGLAAVMWWQGTDLEHWAWPALGMALTIEAAEPWWGPKRLLGRVGWPYALVLGLGAVPFIDVYFDQPAVGAGAFATGGLVWLYAAARSNGAIGLLLSGQRTEAGVIVERQVLGLGSVAMFFAAMGYLAHALELELLEGAWAYAAAGTALWLGAGLLGQQVRGLQGILGPAGAAAFAIAVLTGIEHPEQVGLMLGGGAIAAAIAVQPPYPAAWRAAMAGASLLAVLFAHAGAAELGVGTWELPTTYGIVLAAVVWDSTFNGYDRSWLPVPALAAMAGTTAIWAGGGGPEHGAWSALGAAAVVAGAEGFWRGRSAMAWAGWPYVLALSLAPVLFLMAYDDEALFGSLAFAGAAALWGYVAVRAPYKGRAALWAHSIFGSGAFTLALASVGFANQAAELSPADGAWSVLALGIVAWLSLAGLGQRYQILLPVSLYGGLLATGVALLASGEHYGESALLLGISSAGSAASIYGGRQWPMLHLPVLGAMGTLAFAWAWQEWEPWTLALVFGGIAFPMAASLSKWRTWQPGARPVTAALVSLYPMAIAAYLAYSQVEAQAAATLPSERVETTAEWAALAALVALSGVMLTLEGRRLKKLTVVIGGTAVLLVSLEMGIAMLTPPTNQAYTTPLGLYLVLVALMIRRSDPLFGRHMDLHEGLMALGVALVVVPGAADALERGHIGWSLLLIGEALLFIFAGFVLDQRWLVVGGVVTLVGVAGRFYIAEGQRVPYWLTLGIVGTALLAAGVLMLGARDWWDRTRHRVATWWVGKQYKGGSGFSAT